MNYLAAFTSALGVGIGMALQTGAVPPKYAGYLMIGAVMVQTFQTSVRRKEEVAPPFTPPAIYPKDQSTNSPLNLDGTRKQQ